MGFIESFIAWLVVIFVVAIILYVVFNYILGWVYPQGEEVEGQRQVQNDDEVQIEKEEDIEKKKRQRLIVIFIFVIMAILISSGGVSAYMNTSTNN